MGVGRRDLLACGVGVIVGIGLVAGVDAYRDWSRTRQCEEHSREVSIFVDDAASTEEVAGLERALSENPGIESVDYISQEQAFEEFKKLYEDQPHLYETVDPDDLPSVFRLVAANEDAVAEVYELENPAIDEIRGGEPEILGLYCRLGV